jgi:hypothetical protein
MIEPVTWWSSDEYERFRAEILSDFEDDALGVYEVWWTANTRFPARSVSDRLAIAESIVSELVTNGTAHLYRGRWIGPTHERQAVPESDLETILLGWGTWVPQENDVIWMDKSGQ